MPAIPNLKLLFIGEEHQDVKNLTQMPRKGRMPAKFLSFRVNSQPSRFSRWKTASVRFKFGIAANTHLNLTKAMKRIARIEGFMLISALAASVLCMSLSPGQAAAKNNPQRYLPALEEFIEQVENGDADTLRGAYIPGVLALPVVQQPAGNSNYVSTHSAALTQFRMADKAGNVGLLAHNYLAGKLFFKIELSNLIILVYGNRRTETFRVARIYTYAALSNGIYQETETQKILDIGGLFKIMYSGKRHVTLQTCIAKGGDPSWGRLFIVGKALSSEKAREIQPLPPSMTAVPPAPAAPPTVVTLGWPLNYLKNNPNKHAPATPHP